MKNFKLVTLGREINFNFPTNLNEITEDYLNYVTRNVAIADHYSLVAIVYHETLGSVILARKQSKKSITGAVVPMFIKAGNTDSDFIKSIKCKDKIIASSAQLSLGYHVACPENTLSLDYFLRWLDEDTTVAARYKNNYGNEECFFVEFKIIGNADIIGFYDNVETPNYKNPYTSISHISEGE